MDLFHAKEMWDESLPQLHYIYFFFHEEEKTVMFLLFLDFPWCQPSVV